MIKLNLYTGGLAHINIDHILYYVEDSDGLTTTIWMLGGVQFSVNHNSDYISEAINIAVQYKKLTGDKV